MEDFRWYLVAIFAALAGVVIWIERVRERRRSQALQDLALRLGMTFLEKDDGLSGSDFGGLPLFERGSSKRFRNVLRRGDDWVFGYQFTTGSGDSRKTHRQTVAARRRSDGALPAFQATPEGVFDRLGVLFGGQDLDFEEDPEFSRRFRVKSEDEAAVRQLFHPGLRRQLLAAGKGCLEGRGEWLIYYRRSKRVSPDELSDFMEQSRQVFDLVG